MHSRASVTNVAVAVPVPVSAVVASVANVVKAVVAKAVVSAVSVRKAVVLLANLVRRAAIVTKAPAVVATTHNFPYDL